MDNSSDFMLPKLHEKLSSVIEENATDDLILDVDISVSSTLKLVDVEEEAPLSFELLPILFDDTLELRKEMLLKKDEDSFDDFETILEVLESATSEE